MKEKESIFLNGIENLKAIGFSKQLSFFTSIKVFFFYIYLCIVAGEKTVGESVFFINGSTELGRIDPTKGKMQRIAVRRFSNSKNGLANEISLPSLLDYHTRARLIIIAMFTVPRGGHYLGRWFEYLLLNEVFDTINIRKVGSFGHYDEFTYWITELCKNKNIHYSMYQHGIVMNSIYIPFKIYCNEIHVYNEYSKEVFKKNIITNPQCEYFMDGFISNIAFKKLDKQPGKKYVGVVDQTFPEWVDKILEILSHIDGIVTVFLLHPLSEDVPYNLKESDNLIITREKYDNLDCIITEFSTLALDYSLTGQSVKIISTDEKAVKEIFRGMDILFIPIQELEQELLEVV